MPDPRPNPEKQVSTNERQSQLREALLELPEDQRLAVELHIMEDWPHEKVAAFLGKSVEASRALQYRALQTLRKSTLISRM
jgi:RNA polymerase sigma factor (sigma-70 family)